MSLRNIRLLSRRLLFILSLFLLYIYIYIFPIEISHDFILPYSTPFPPWSGYVREREESLRTLRNEATGDNATWMDISGPRERNYDRLFTSRLRFEPYFSPSISRRRSSRAQYEVTGEGAYEARICIVRRRVGRRRRRMKRHGFSTSSRCFVPLPTLAFSQPFTTLLSTISRRCYFRAPNQKTPSGRNNAETLVVVVARFV